MSTELQLHTIAPIYNNQSRILILGSFPSVKSRELGFYYAHPQNRFWRVVSGVFNKPLPISVQEKTKFLLDNRIALWDVIKSCEIENSADSTIKSVVPNDLSEILNTSKINTIYANGKTSEKLYNQYIKKITGVNIVTLPSTSPANAKFNIDRLIDEWKIISGN